VVVVVVVVVVVAVAVAVAAVAVVVVAVVAALVDGLQRGSLGGGQRRSWQKGRQWKREKTKSNLNPSLTITRSRSVTYFYTWHPLFWVHPPAKHTSSCIRYPDSSSPFKCR